MQYLPRCCRGCTISDIELQIHYIDEIGDTKLLALIDSGALFNFVSSSVAKHLIKKSSQTKL